MEDSIGNGTGEELWDAIVNTLEHYVPTAEELRAQFEQSKDDVNDDEA